MSNWHSIFTLVVFLLTNLVGVFPIHFSVPLPRSVGSLVAKTAVYLRICVPKESCCDLHPDLYKTRRSLQCIRKNDGDEVLGPSVRWHKTAIDFQTAPLIAVLLLLATGSLKGSDVRKGIVGTNEVEPLNIMALFVSLAYMAISLDTTGLFRFLAFWVVRKGGSSGRLLYLYLYLFFFVSGIFVGNDPVVLFGTPFLAYFSHVSGILPSTAWIFAQFTTANMSSAVLPSSNLTNLVLTEAFSFSFISFAAHTIIPTIATAAAVYPVLFFALFHSKKFIPAEVNVVTLQRTASEQGDEPINEESREPRNLPGELNDKHGAIFGSVLLGITLAVLVGTSPLNVSVWMITVPPALIMLTRDIWHDRTKWGRQSPIGNHANNNSGAMELQRFPASASQNMVENEVTPEEKGKSTVLSYYQDLKENTLPTLLSIIPRLPVSLVLFAFCMFILVQALTTWGWVEIFASWWASWIDVCGKKGISSETIGAIWGMLIVSTFLCNLCGTNIGTTILLARVLQVWLERSASSNIFIDPKVRLGAIYALALGTNFGAFSFSFSASLAGLLWRDILRQKGIIVRQKQFALTNLPLIGTAIVVSGAVLIAEVNIVSN